MSKAEQVEQLLSTGNQVLTSIIANATQAKEFLVSETPIILEQLLWWHGIQSALYCSAGFMLLAIVFINWILFYKKFPGMDDDMWGPWAVVSGLISLALVPISVDIILSHIDWLKILVAPKLYLLEYAASLVK
jgi:hypothetical protein